MHDFRDPSPDGIDQHELDRLADGELSDAEERALLLRMEDALARGNGQPWRRCALALLEAQTLRREVQEWSRLAHRPAPESKTPAPSQPGRRTRGTGLALACAASFGGAFALVAGLQTGGLRSPAEPPIAALAPQEAMESLPPQVASPREAPVAEAIPATEAAEDEVWPWLPAGSLTLAVEGADGATTQRVEVPLYETSDGAVPPVLPLASATPQELVEALEGAGRRVSRAWQLWPLTLQDGRQVIVPIEQVVVSPPNLAAIQ